MVDIFYPVRNGTGQAQKCPTCDIFWPSGASPTGDGGNTRYEMSLCTEIRKNIRPENTENIRFLMPKGAGDPSFVFLSVKSDWQLSSNPVKDLQLLIFCRGNTQEQKQLGVTARVLFLSLNVSREKQKKNSLLCKGDFFVSLPSQTVLFLWLFFSIPSAQLTSAQTAQI